MASQELSGAGHKINNLEQVWQVVGMLGMVIGGLGLITVLRLSGFLADSPIKNITDLPNPQLILPTFIQNILALGH